MKARIQIEKEFINKIKGDKRKEEMYENIRVRMKGWEILKDLKD